MSTILENRDGDRHRQDAEAITVAQRMKTFDDFMPDSPDASGGGDLEVLRLAETPALVTIFTNKIGAAFTHYLDCPTSGPSCGATSGPNAVACCVI